MQLTVTIPADADTDPAHPDVLSQVAGQIAAKATAWTEPVYTGDTTSPTGTRLLTYTTDAVPRVVGVTTLANVSPVLLPARVL